MAADLRHLSAWTGAAVHEECRSAYAAYRKAKIERYQEYFATNPSRKDAAHAYKARDLKAALPERWGDLAGLIPREERHIHHLSANSSQVLALGLLGSAATIDSSMSWLWSALDEPARRASWGARWQFEAAVSPELLGERPRQTSIDFLVEDPESVICLEAKWVEEGIGGCSCANGGGHPATGRCLARVLERPAYWETASEIFGLPGRREGEPCPLSFTYQAVRNVAAGLALAGEERSAVFALLYDVENPYFVGCGEWPGWAEALTVTLEGAHPRLRFHAARWQDLVAHLPIDDDVRDWAGDKHGLITVG